MSIIILYKTVAMIGDDFNFFIMAFLVGYIQNRFVVIIIIVELYSATFGTTTGIQVHFAILREIHRHTFDYNKKYTFEYN